jgi:hypothetical protein
VVSALSRGEHEDIVGRGALLRGELIEATRGTLLLRGEADLSVVALDDVARIRARRHGVGAKQVLTWVAIGAAVTGAGLTYACTQYEGGGGCGGVFLSAIGAWGIIGGLLASATASSAWRDLPITEEGLRPYARFPQGAPRGFRIRAPIARPR